MTINVGYNQQPLVYTSKNNEPIVPGESTLSGNIDIKKSLSASNFSAIISSNAEKNGSDKTTSFLPALKTPAAVADRAQLSASLKGISEINQALPTSQVQTVLLNSVDTQVTRLVQEMQTSKETSALSASEASIVASFNSILGSNNAIVYSGESEVEHSASDTVTRQAAIDGIVAGTKPSGSFDAQVMANSRTQGLLDSLDDILKAEQQNKFATIELKTKTTELAFKHGQSSATQLVNAGIAGRDQAITMGATSIGLAGAGGTMQYRGASKTIKAQTVHGTQANKLTQQANKYEAQAASTLSSDTLAAQNDAKILKQTALLKQNEASKQALEANRVSLLGNRQQANGGLIAANAGNMGQLTSAQYHVTQAEHQSESQLRATDQQVSNAHAETKEREAQNDQQIIQQLLQQLTQIAQERNTTVSSMIRS